MGIVPTWAAWLIVSALVIAVVVVNVWDRVRSRRDDGNDNGGAP